MSLIFFNNQAIKLKNNQKKEVFGHFLISTGAKNKNPLLIEGFYKIVSKVRLSQTLNLFNYFLAAVSTALTVVSTALTVVSTAGAATTAAAVSPSAFFSSPPAQDAKDAAITANTNNFFIFLCFNWLYDD